MSNLELDKPKAPFLKKKKKKKVAGETQWSKQHEEKIQVKKKDLNSKRNLLLALKLSEHSNHIHLQEPQHMGLNELAKVLFIVFESFQTQYHKESFFPYQFLPSPKGSPWPSVVVKLRIQEGFVRTHF